MEKNWLIRTQQHKILGPVSKEKIIELVQKKSLSPEDEICPGNGFWFFLREKELLNQHLMGDIPPHFNPVSEAPSRVSGHDDDWIESFLKQMENGKTPARQAPVNSPAADVTLVKNLNDFKDALNEAKTEDSFADKLPEASDLEYPDLSNTKDPTMPSIPTISVAAFREQSKETPADDGVDDPSFAKLPEASDLEYPDFAKEEVPAPKEEILPPPMEFGLEENSVLPKEVKKPIPLPPKNGIKKPMPKPIVSEAVASDLPLKAETKSVDKSGQKPSIDPMVLLHISQTASRPAVKTKRNDHYLVIAFVLILAVIGFLFYQYKAMVKKTIAAKSVQKTVREVPPTSPSEENVAPVSIPVDEK